MSDLRNDTQPNDGDRPSGRTRLTSRPLSAYTARRRHPDDPDPVTNAEGYQKQREVFGECPSNWKTERKREYWKATEANPEAAKKLLEEGWKEEREKRAEADRRMEKERETNLRKDKEKAKGWEESWDSRPLVQEGNAAIRLDEGRPAMAVYNKAGLNVGVRRLDPQEGEELVSVAVESDQNHFLYSRHGELQQADGATIYLTNDPDEAEVNHESTGAPVMLMTTDYDSVDDYLYHIAENGSPRKITIVPGRSLGYEDGRESPFAAATLTSDFNGEMKREGRDIEAGFMRLPEGVDSSRELLERGGPERVRSCAENMFSVPEELAYCHSPWRPNFQALWESWALRSRDHIVGAPPLVDALSMRELLEAPEPDHLIEDVLQRDGIGLVYAESGAGKTFVATDIGCSVRKKRKWHGHNVTNTPVLYVCLEAEKGFGNRVKAWTMYHDAEDLEDDPLVRFITEQVSLLNDSDVDRFIATVKRLAIRHGLIVIDTFNAFTLGMEENSSVDMGKAIKNLRCIAEETDNFVLLVGHPGKDVARGPRGHSSLFAALDVVIVMTKDKDGRICLRLEKLKDGESGIEHFIRLKTVEIGKDRYGKPITSCVAVPDENGAEAPAPTAAAKEQKPYPIGHNQIIVFEVVGERLKKSSHYGKAGAPAHRPCIPLTDAVSACIGRLGISDEWRERARASEAIVAMVKRGVLMRNEGWIWVP